MSEVARAVGKAILKRLDQFPCCDVSAGLGYLEGVQGVDLELELGRAALEAIREPTAAMLEAGPPEPYMDAGVWSQMISAALKEPAQLPSGVHPTNPAS